jgi:hypothetical protein
MSKMYRFAAEKRLGVFREHPENQPDFAYFASPAIILVE